MKRKEYIEGSTLHGLNRAYSSSHQSEKWFWIFMIIAGLFGLTIGFSILVFKYLAYEINLEITDRIDEDVEFPSITFCNNERISTSYMTDEYYGYYGKHPIQSAFSDHFYEYAKKFPYFCRIFGQNCNFTEDFTTYGYHDPCITWNMKGLVAQKLPGIYNGIEMAFFLNATITNYTNYLHSKNTITVIMHSSNEFPSIFFDNFEIGAGVQTRIELKKRKYLRLPSPYPSKCTDINKLLDTKEVYSYTRNSCFEMCFIRQVLKDCGVVMQPRFRALIPDWMIAQYEKNVTLDEYTNCHRILKWEFFINGLGYCDCPLACNEVIYNRRIQTVPLDVEYLYSFISQNNISLGDLDNFKKSIFSIRVYYPRLESENAVERAAYEMSDVFNDFGGLLGLAIGASVISVVELLAICCLTFFSKRKINKR